MTRLRVIGLALTTGVLLGTTACGGDGVTDAVRQAAAEAEPTVPIEDMTTEELLESDLGEGAYEEDGVLYFPAVFGIPELTMPDGAAITNVSYDINPGFYIQEVSADDLYDSVEEQLTAAGFAISRNDINGQLFMNAERPGSGPVTVAPIGEDIISIGASVPQ
ncbi:hypothetical protein TEK04_13940 [Klenkia sp. LSe6-5]|uniref:PASTA domain-containing protein n=1 Tax=Klenkia sesuvii TaxID=3103137 RepID=A0ABU8DVF3_9ACTN